MSFFEDASLVYIPAAVKNGKTYSIKPTDGTGDLTFTRASSATRVGPNGYIEKVRENIVKYSEDATNALWVKSGLIITGNTSTAPDGTTTADTLETTTTAQCQMIQSVTFAAGTYTASVYAKKVDLNAIYVELGNSFAWFNINNGTLGTGGQYSTGWLYNTHTIEDAGNGWYRCSLTSQCTIAGGYSYRAMQPVAAVSGYFSNASGADTLFWGAQVELSDFGPTPYIKTEAAAVSVGPVSGTPRLDYLGSDCGRLLLEPQRSNVFLQSEAINNAAWSVARYTRTANQTASPTGYVDADLCTPTATSGTHEIFPTTGISFSATAYTMSLFAKYNGYNISLGAAGASTDWTGCVFDLQNGIAKTPQSAGSQSVCTAKIENYGNGWYRCSITFTPYTTPTFYPTFGAVDSANATLGAWGAQNFTADGTSGAYLWGAQLEAGAYATSYIGPTLGTAVTRVADAATKTGISSLIGQTEGTLFVELDSVNFSPTGGAQLCSLDDGTASKRMELYTDTLNRIGVYVQNTTAQVNQTTSVVASGTVKIALAYKQDDFAVYVNGTLAHSDTSGTVPATSAFRAFGRYDGLANGSQRLNQALIFKTRLTNAQLAELTTL